MVHFALKQMNKGDYLADFDLNVPPISSIRELEQISLGYEKGNDERWIEQLVNPGSSLGGARPKANVKNTDGSLWIAKFPSRYDDYDIGAWEKVAHDIAKKCHIDVPESKLCRYSDLGSTFLVKRFDRLYDSFGAEQRIHFASAMTMLGLSDGNTDGVGFLDLAEVVAKITVNTDKELEALLRRVVFDIAISNHDDHLRNHGFLLKDNKWSLSPSYDLNPVYNADYLSMNIDMDDGRRSFDKALSTASFYHLTNEKAQDIIKEISETVTGSWYRLATKYGISEAEKRRMAPAFDLAAKHASASTS
ncbi:MAG: HipA domain-containing protein [Lachnospiraceae bacterium]|nr:HipA domain-containing protein [Lachnospiraceae bacterium]